MESLNRRSRLKRDGVSIDGLPHDRKIELEAFGWVSVASPKHLEFDLWPTPRPNAAARLVIKGHDAKLTGDRRVPPAGNEAGVQQYGYVIDNSGPKHGTEEPTLACVPSPVDYPNHLHCEYDDAAGDRGSETGETDNYGNPRMTPFYATSRFELRVGMEWQ